MSNCHSYALDLEVEGEVLMAEPQPDQETIEIKEEELRLSFLNQEKGTSVNMQIDQACRMENTEKNKTGMTVLVSLPKTDIALNSEFSSFVELKEALSRYQKDNCVQLVVKDSKLLAAESTRKVLPKVHHLVPEELLYHSIVYCCKCHGQLKHKPNTRIRNIGAKRLNCQMYMRFKLNADYQKLVLFDMNEEHNHDIDPNTCQLAPRQSVYALSRLKQGMPSEKEAKAQLLQEPKSKRQRMTLEEPLDGEDSDESFELTCETQDTEDYTFLDSESSASDSDDESSLPRHLPFPTRLIGSAIKSSPELIEVSKELIEQQKKLLVLKNALLVQKTKHLELQNMKLEHELKILERNMLFENAMSDTKPDTTIYLHTNE